MESSPKRKKSVFRQSSDSPDRTFLKTVIMIKDDLRRSEYLEAHLVDVLLPDGPGVPGEGTLRCPISRGSLRRRQPLRVMSRRTGASRRSVSRAGLAVTA